MITLCKSEELLQKDILDSLDAVRKMRNKVHIGGLTVVTKSFPKKDVKFALEVLEKTVQSVKLKKKVYGISKQKTCIFKVSQKYLTNIFYVV